MSEEPFLKRWSRRKVEAREGPKPGDARGCRGGQGRRAPIQDPSDATSSRRPGRRRSAS